MNIALLLHFLFGPVESRVEYSDGLSLINRVRANHEPILSLGSPVRAKSEPRFDVRQKSSSLSPKKMMGMGQAQAGPGLASIPSGIWQQPFLLQASMATVIIYIAFNIKNDINGW